MPPRERGPPAKGVQDVSGNLLKPSGDIGKFRTGVGAARGGCEISHFCIKVQLFALVLYKESEEKRKKSEQKRRKTKKCEEKRKKGKFLKPSGNTPFSSRSCRSCFASPPPPSCGASG